jgi:hypothetical protein
VAGNTVTEPTKERKGFTLSLLITKNKKWEGKS